MAMTKEKTLILNYQRITRQIIRWPVKQAALSVNGYLACTYQYWHGGGSIMSMEQGANFERFLAHHKSSYSRASREGNVGRRPQLAYHHSRDNGDDDLEGAYFEQQLVYHDFDQTMASQVYNLTSWQELVHKIPVFG